MDTTTITIAGRKFKGVGRDGTLEHDIYTMDLVRMCGLDIVDRVDVETHEAFARRVFLLATRQGRFFELMGGLLLPADRNAADWTPEMAVSTGRFLAGVTNKADKELVKNQVVVTLASFFASGISSVRTLPRSSTRAGKRQGRQRGAAGTMASGTAS